VKKNNENEKHVIDIIIFKIINYKFIFKIKNKI